MSDQSRRKLVTLPRRVGQAVEQNRHRIVVDRSVSPSTRELVVLNRPRPAILRKHNAYEPISDRSGPDRSWIHPESSMNRKWADPTNFDRPKVHKARRPDALGDIRPLVTHGQKATDDSISRQRLSNIDKSSEMDDKRRVRHRSSPPDLRLDRLRDTATTSASEPRTRSILCPLCGRCRCSQCSHRRLLPSIWICNDSCLLSCESLVDCLSCLCAVRTCLYHSNSDQDQRQNLLDCTQSSGSTRRWTCLTLAAIFLPCIWCYFPLKAGSLAVQSLYGRYQDHSCHCQNRRSKEWQMNSNRGRTVIKVQPGKTAEFWPGCNEK